MYLSQFDTVFLVLCHFHIIFTEFLCQIFNQSKLIAQENWLLESLLQWRCTIFDQGIFSRYKINALFNHHYYYGFYSFSVGKSDISGQLLQKFML